MNTLPSSGLPPSTTPPPIIVSNRDFNRLEQLLDSPGLRRHPAAVALMDELNRADVLPPEQMPEGVVTMHSTVECEDELAGERAGQVDRVHIGAVEREGLDLALAA